MALNVIKRILMSDLVLVTGLGACFILSEIPILGIKPVLFSIYGSVASFLFFGYLIIWKLRVLDKIKIRKILPVYLSLLLMLYFPVLSFANRSLHLDLNMEGKLLTVVSDVWFISWAFIAVLIGVSHAKSFFIQILIMLILGSVLPAIQVLNVIVRNNLCLFLVWGTLVLWFFAIKYSERNKKKLASEVHQTMA